MLFRKYYLVTAGIVLMFIFAGYQASRILIQLNQNNQAPFEGRSSMFYAHLIDRIAPKDRVKGLSEIQQSNPSPQSAQFAIVAEDGKVLSSDGESLGPDWSTISKPEHPYEVRALPHTDEPGVQELIRFDGEPPQYLYVSMKRPPDRARRRGMFAWTFSSLVVSVLLGIAFAMFILFRSLRESVVLADSVIADLQGGNLKARFPVRSPLRKGDEVGRVMSRFNRMAEEIERLVEQLRGVEKSRMNLLQELAHDLRTPVASLKNLLETIQKAGSDSRVGEELIALSIQETEYFERLVEDLLVLAQVSEPRYQSGKDEVAFNELLEDEADGVSVSHGIALHKELPNRALYVRGDAHLLRRMIRNGLENAISFAKNSVTLTLEESESGCCKVTIEDDGPGFSAEALKSYGERRVSRTLGASGGKGERLSVGLGSVILKTVAQVHGGSVEVSNRADTPGARLMIVIPSTSIG